MMENKITCPICHHKANHKIYSSEICLEEEYTNCPTCGFRREFAYGGELIIVGNEWFSWNYTLNGDKLYRLLRKIRKAKFIARRNWKKFRKKTNPKDCPV